MPFIPYSPNPFDNRPPSTMFAPPFNFHHRAAELRKRFQNSQSSNYSFASGDNINPFGNYHFISRIFPQRNDLVSQGSIHPGFSIFKLGEKGSGFRQRAGEAQDFYKLRDELVERQELFEDPDFKAVSASLYYSQQSPRSFEWLRPMEINDDPEFIVEGASRFDIMQGELGDCWLLAAVANLTLNEQLFSQVVPYDQGFKDKYAGIFHFRFWQYGRWVDVVIDDRLPTVGGKLVFMHSSQPNEFWSALLEKAFAKLHGSYEALKGGGTSEAMEDFTGGVAEMFELKEAPQNLFTIMLKAYERMSLMACAIEADANTFEAQTAEGLVKGHAYSITKIKYVDIATPTKKGKIPLIRLRNPWGNETEWKGAWSDKSPEWNFIPNEEKQMLGLTFEQDGEFWMAFQDFVKRFDRLEVCLINPDTLPDELKGECNKRWEMSVFEGEWTRGVSAGGCRNYLETFHYNPQYRITLDDIDEEDEENKCTVIIALMQKNRRALRKIGAECLTIGFAVYRLNNPDSLPKPLNMEFFRTNTSAARCPSFVNLREVTCRFKLPPGVYCIVPSTFEPNQEGEFILRIFSEKKNHMEENDQPVEIGEIDDRVKQQQPDAEEEKRYERLKEFFRKIAGEDLEVDWIELKQILDYAMKNGNALQGGFSKDVCRSMIAMMDVDRSGKLGFEEFKKLWIDIRSWQRVFKLYDKENTGFLSPFELREALASAGYHLNTHILNVLGHRYAGKDGKIAFDDFMMCAVRLKSMMEIFQERAAGKDIASFKLEEWIETTLYS
ncbi:calpain-A isoform X2 [Planococcus citri]|uniref:calpain-A isoform X2 n=1 Tax=Planococcus citri TaxID=170843 RepID=UPI0031F9BD7C